LAHMIVIIIVHQMQLKIPFVACTTIGKLWDFLLPAGSGLLQSPIPTARGTCTLAVATWATTTRATKSA